MNDIAPRSARRAATVTDDTVAELETTPLNPRRGARVAGASKRLVAMAVTGAVSAVAIFAFAFASRGNDASSESDEANAAIPAAAASAVKEGFSDRSEEVSRGAVRSNLSEAVNDENAKERDAALGAAVESAENAETESSAKERERLMEADLKLVAKQSDQLKKEAEEAAKRLEAARKAAAAAKDGNNSPVETEDLTTVDISNLTSSGGSMPLKSGYRLGASFGQVGSWSRYHTGQDFPAATGTPIYAAASGVVLSSSAGGWAGTNVVIQHANGGATLYAHMSAKNVSPGQTVRAGQQIGAVGNTGRSFGSHLHFEYYPAGTTPGDVYRATNPMSFLRSLGVG